MQQGSLTFQPACVRTTALLSDGELLRRAAADDQRAFETLFARHRDGLQGFLYRKLRDQDEAEDAVTATFCNAWRARETFRGDSPGKSWLYQIAARVALDVLRRRRRHPAEQELDAMPAESLEIDGDWDLDPSRQLAQKEQRESARRAVAGALGRLPDEERRLVALFYFDGHNYDEISSILGVTRSQVRGRLHRIRGRIRNDMVRRQQWGAAC